MTIEEQYTLLENTIRAYNPAADFAQIRAAFDYADKCHQGQKRKSGEPYIIHPLAVAQIVAEELKLDSESIEAALLHDVRNAETTAYFNQFASGNNHLFVFGKRGKHKCHCGGIVIYDSGMLTADNTGDPCRAVIRSFSP